VENRVAAKLSDAGALSLNAARRVIDSNTIGKTLHNKYLYHRLDVDVTDLDALQQRRLNELIERNGRDGVRLANDLDDDTLDTFLSPTCGPSGFSVGGVSLSPGRYHRISTDFSALDGGCDLPEDLPDDFRTSLSRAYDGSDGASIDDIEATLDAVDSAGAHQGPLMAFVRSGDDAGVRATAKLRAADSVDSGAFARKIEPLDAGEKREIARMVAEADDGVKLADELSYHQLQRIADQDTGWAVSRLNNRGIEVNRIERLVDEGVDLQRVDTLLTKRYSGWSTGGKGFSGHYADHTGEWSPKLTKEEYGQKAESLLNRDRTGLEVYYQKGRDNLVVYDRGANELAVGGNPIGEIQTLFKPESISYVDGKIGDEWLTLKEP